MLLAVSVSITVKLPVTIPVPQFEEAAGVLVWEAKQCRKISSSPQGTEDIISLSPDHQTLLLYF